MPGGINLTRYLYVFNWLFMGMCLLFHGGGIVFGWQLYFANVDEVRINTLIWTSIVQACLLAFLIIKEFKMSSIGRKTALSFFIYLLHTPIMLFSRPSF